MKWSMLFLLMKNYTYMYLLWEYKSENRNFVNFLSKLTFWINVAISTCLVTIVIANIMTVLIISLSTVGSIVIT